MTKHKESLSTKLEKSWHAVAAFVYLLICLTDFVFMPIYYEYSNSQSQKEVVIMDALKFDGGVAQVEALKILRESRTWTPLTLAQSGLFHIAFGSILTAGVWRKNGNNLNPIQPPPAQ